MKTQRIETYNVIYQAMIRAIGGRITRDFRFEALDNKYILPDKEFVQKVIDNAGVNYYDYKGEVFDCEDFSRVLYAEFAKAAYGHTPVLEHGFAFGMMCGRFNREYHCLNFFIDDKLDFWLVEPQVSKIYRLPEDDEQIWFALL